MRELISIYKGDYNTLRDLERKSYRLFYLGGGLVVLGILVIIASFSWLTFLGLPLVLLGGAVFFFGMLWMAKLQKQPTVPVHCPYCAARMDLFRGRAEFACDMCSRRIVMSPGGEPLPGEPEDASS